MSYFTSLQDNLLFNFFLNPLPLQGVKKISHIYIYIDIFDLFLIIIIYFFIFLFLLGGPFSYSFTKNHTCNKYLADQKY
jgi:hypothetical protein